MTSHPLDDARALVERAIEQIERLQDEFNAFFKEDPYRLVEEPLSGVAPGGSVLVRGFIEREPPRRFRILIGEIVHGLRAALDYIVWQLVIANGQRGTRGTGFPVCDAHAQYLDHGTRNVKGVAAAAQALIESMQPYHQELGIGFSKLWLLHQLDRIRKHRALNIVACAVELRELSVHHTWFDRVPDGTLPLRELHVHIPRMKILKTNPENRDIRPSDRVVVPSDRIVIPFANGEELFRIASTATDQDVRLQLRIGFTLAFEEPGIARAQPVPDTLEDLLSVTARTFDAFLAFFPDEEQT